MQSIREYAKNNGVSYEAVRQQIVRYREDLGKHIVRTGKTQYLDDDAVAFLDSKRRENPVILLEQSREEENKRWEGENKALLQRVASLQDQLLAVQPKLALAEHAQQLIEAKDMLLNERTEQMRKLEGAVDDARQREDRMRDRLETVTAEKAAADQRCLDLERQRDDTKRENEELRDKYDRMNRRGLWARITNKEV